MSVVLNAARQKACVYVGYVVVTLETYTVVFFKWSVWVIGLGCNESEVDSTDIGGWDVLESSLLHSLSVGYRMFHQ